MNSRPYSKSWRASATRCRTPSRRLALPIKSSPRRPSVCDKSESRCRGERDHLTPRPDAKRGKSRSSGSGAAVCHKEKNPPTAQYQCHPGILLGKNPAVLRWVCFSLGRSEGVEHAIWESCNFCACGGSRGRIGFDTG